MKMYLLIGQLIVRIVLTRIALRRYGQYGAAIRVCIGAAYAITGLIMDMLILGFDVGISVFVCTHFIIIPAIQFILNLREVRIEKDDDFWWLY